MPKEQLKFRNVAVLHDDHERLRRLASHDQRSMARELTVLIRNAYIETFDTEDVESTV
jgi:uncharacterized protein YaeQ